MSSAQPSGGELARSSPELTRSPGVGAGVVDRLAEEILDAHAAGTAITKPSARMALDPPTAEAVRRRVVMARVGGAYERAAGYKVSVVDPARQQRVGTSEPEYGVLLTEEVLDTPAELPLQGLRAPLVEAEVAFIARRELRGSPTLAEITEACDVAPAIEIPDSRFTDWFPRSLTLSDLIADNAVTGRLVIGPARPASDIDFPRLRVSLERDGQLLAVGGTDTVMGDPRLVLAWLVRRLAGEGRALRTGQLISSGTFVAPDPVAKKSAYTARFESLGAATATFVD